MSDSPSDPKEPNQETLKLGVELEHKALRDEILTRIRLRQQIVGVTLTLSGLFLGLGVTHDVVLVYPPLAFFLALSWAQNDYKIRDLATYIKEEIEGSFETIGWEHYNGELRKLRGQKSDLRAWRYVIVSHGGIFILSQLLAIGMGIVKFKLSATQVFFFIVSILSVAGVIWLSLEANSRKKEMKN